MRYIIFILLIFLFGCRSTKEVETIVKVESVESADIYDYDEYEEDVKLVINPDKILSGSAPIGQEIEEDKSNIITGNSNNKSKSEVIKEERHHRKLPYTMGKMAYSIPDTMKVGQQYDISLRITKYEKDSILIEGIDRNDEVKSKIVINDIRVGSVMSAVLIDVDSNFVIKSTSTTEQNIEDFGYTQWLWKVKPIKSGDNKLRLLIKVRVFTDNGDYLKDIPVFDQKVKVHSNIPWTLKSWVSKYWQWLMSTIIIPIFIYFWKRKKKDKNESTS